MAVFMFNRKDEFPQLKDVVYLDHTGATLPSARQLDAFHGDLKETLYGNPHSRSVSSSLTTESIDQARYRVLKHFNATADTHSVIFTSGCTGALKLLAETFEWSGSKAEGDTEKNSEETAASSGENETDDSNSVFCYIQDNHTSVVGMREVANARGAQSLCLSERDISKVFAHVKDGDIDSSVTKSDENALPVTGTKTQESPNKPSRCIQLPNNLFAFPAQSNFCGHKYPLDWIDHAKEGKLASVSGNHGNWYVVLDAAALVSTSPLDLSACKADFVAISFYKMFGFPTGLGALIVRNESAHLLVKEYFGGGTVMAYLPSERFHKPRATLADRFEDGTPPYIDIISLRHGFDALELLGGGMKAISKHTFNLAKFVHDTMSNWQHSNGSPIAEIYSQGPFESHAVQGPILNFNLLRSNGEYVGYAEVERLAALHDIHLRTGCFCNTGACQQYVGLTNQGIKDNLEAGHVCGDDMDLIDGRPTGSVRISFGYMSNMEDAQRFLSFVKTCFLLHEETSTPVIELPSQLSAVTLESSQQTAEEVEQSFSSVEQPTPPVSSSSSSHMTNKQHPQTESRIEESPTTMPFRTALVPTKSPSSPESITLSSIILYPVKSCGAMEVSEWEVGRAGLKYDRHWMVVNEGGVYMSQKRIPRLCLIKPTIDLEKQRLILSHTDMPSISLPLEKPRAMTNERALGQGKVCGDRVNTIDCGDEVAHWLSKVTGQRCRLQQQDPNYHRASKLGRSTKSASGGLSLANQSQYLLITKSSTSSLMSAMQQSPHREAEQSLTVLDLMSRFRPNLVVEGCDAFEEESWSSIAIGYQKYEVKGRCNRCQMICIDQDTAEKSMEPLSTLSTIRGKKIFFGVHVMNDPAFKDGVTLRTGDQIKVVARNNSTETPV